MLEQSVYVLKENDWFGKRDGNSGNILIDDNHELVFKTDD